MTNNPMLVKYCCCLIAYMFAFINCYSQIGDYNHSGGTCIIAVIGADSAWIAADSKQTTAVSSTDRIIGSRSVCKIGITNNVFYAFSSPYVTLEALGHVFFDAYKVMATAIQENSSFDAAFTQFERRLSRNLSLVSRNDSVLNYDEFIKKGDSLVLFQALVVTFINHKPVYKFREYYNSKQSQGKISIASDSSSEDNSLPMLLILGNRQSIDSFLNSNQADTLSMDEIRQWAPFFISLEAQSHPEVIDNMINLIAIGNDNRYQWLIKKQSCE